MGLVPVRESAYLSGFLRVASFAAMGDEHLDFDDAAALPATNDIHVVTALQFKGARERASLDDAPVNSDRYPCLLGLHDPSGEGDHATEAKSLAVLPAKPRLRSKGRALDPSRGSLELNALLFGVASRSREN
jgi:hypothetical protein